MRYFKDSYIELSVSSFVTLILGVFSKQNKHNEGGINVELEIDYLTIQWLIRYIV